MNVQLIISLYIFVTTASAAKSDLIKPKDGFYSYVSNKGISIEQLSASRYRISHYRWKCDIDTLVAKNFTKKNVSWTDMFETGIEVLSERTVFSPDDLRKKMGVLPKDGTPVTLVARQGNVSIPKENVIIRLNHHGPLDARTTMVIASHGHIKRLIQSSRSQQFEEIFNCTHGSRSGQMNSSQPLVIPENIWDLKILKYYKGPLFFMKGGYSFGHLAECDPYDGIGLAALNRVVHLKGDIATLGFKAGIDRYNTAYDNRFMLLAHKLAWSYFVVKEITDTL